MRPYQSSRSAHVIRPTSARHSYGHDRTWYNVDSAVESRYSDFVPCTYDEENVFARIIQSIKYARSLLIPKIDGEPSYPTGHAPGRRSSEHGLCGDIEMTASLSPTLQGTAISRSPTSSYNASYQSNRFSSSPRPHTRPSPSAVFSDTGRLQSSQKRSLSAVTAHDTVEPTGGPGTQATTLVSDLTSSDAINDPIKERTVFPAAAANPPAEPELKAGSHVPNSADNIGTHSAGNKNTISSSTSVMGISASSSSSSSSQHQAAPSTPSSKKSRAARSSIKSMPLQYETCDTKDLVVLISNMLLELIRHNDDIPLQDGRLTRFHSRAPPSISVRDYLQRLTTHATLSPPILLSMVYYIDRLCALYPAFTISSLTVHRFLITSATVASKGLSDSFWTNNTYARVGGVSLKELALLELEFLWRVEWRIVPKPEVLVDYYRSLIERSEGYCIASNTAALKTKRNRSTGSKTSSETMSSKHRDDPGSSHNRDGDADPVG